MEFTISWLKKDYCDTLKYSIVVIVSATIKIVVKHYRSALI